MCATRDRKQPPPSINALKLKTKGSSEFYLLIDDILAFVNHFDVVVWYFVKRSGNKSGSHAISNLVI